MDDEPQTESEKQEEQRIMAIHAVKSFVLALIILVLAIVLLVVLVLTKEDPKKEEGDELVTSVRVVRSLHEVQLAAEVGGRVIVKSDNLLAGAVVEKGEVLVEIDTADYKAAQARAESALADAKLALKQEQAMAEQAIIDWKKIGRGEPSDLVLRKPQLAAAKARVDSAEAEVLKASRDVERASIRAPFDARVRMATVEVGAVLAPGTPVAELYSTDQLEVRLPFSLLDYGYLDKKGGAEFTVTAKVGGEERSWPAVLDRIDGEVQRSTLSAYGLAKIMPDADGGLPPVGLFVEAKVPGKELDGLVVRANFEEGDQLVMTRLAAPMTGMKVQTIDQDKDQE